MCVLIQKARAVELDKLEQKHIGTLVIQDITFEQAKELLLKKGDRSVVPQLSKCCSWLQREIHLSGWLQDETELTMTSVTTNHHAGCSGSSQTLNSFFCRDSCTTGMHSIQLISHFYVPGQQKSASNYSSTRREFLHTCAVLQVIQNQQSFWKDFLFQHFLQYCIYLILKIFTELCLFWYPMHTSHNHYSERGSNSYTPYSGISPSNEWIQQKNIRFYSRG